MACLVFIFYLLLPIQEIQTFLLEVLYLMLCTDLDGTENLNVIIPI